jgi:carbon monoxide dehydrogenase subunit G
MPGVESFDVQDDRHWRANVKIPLGMGGLKMSINFEKTDERPIEYARLHAKGTGVGALMNMDTEFHLSSPGDGTEMRWEADVRIAGPVGSMGQRVLQPIVNQQVGNVLAALEEQVREASGSEPQSPQEGSGARTEPRTPVSGSEPLSSPGGAEEGIHPASPEAYEPEPEGPTHST